MHETPFILAETGDFAVVFKPPRMHCAPVKQNAGNTLLDWYAAVFPPVMAVSGRQRGDGGLTHRLDFETHGLVLFAKNQRALELFQSMQDRGKITKEYSAVCRMAHVSPCPAGFPPSTPVPGPAGTGFSPKAPFVVESFFRPFGPGRKQVRPVTLKKKHYETAADQGQPYKTTITGLSVIDGNCGVFTLRITRGFRHQIRCHLAWIGYPIYGDTLYGQAAEAESGLLALRAHGLCFADPQTSEPLEYRIAPIGKGGGELPGQS
ncbi:MAG: RNA pseudouridine synthase [Treponema sp.]|jgi:23S rRNA pseudouridine1911/1915/1917 synthase|nr:RNA pseudouridine synthase [Treponema sp.]